MNIVLTLRLSTKGFTYSFYREAYLISNSTSCVLRENLHVIFFTLDAPGTFHFVVTPERHRISFSQLIVGDGDNTPDPDENMMGGLGLGFTPRLMPLTTGPTTGTGTGYTPRDDDTAEFGGRGEGGLGETAETMGGRDGRAGRSTSRREKLEAARLARLHESFGDDGSDGDDVGGAKNAAVAGPETPGGAVSSARAEQLRSILAK